MTKAMELSGLVNENAEILSFAFGLNVDFLVELGIARSDAERIVALVTEDEQIDDYLLEDDPDLFGFVFDDSSVIVGVWDEMCEAGGEVGVGSSIEEAINNLA